jgi:mannose-1-phosphate guanylyltransferase/phosphomannomutase
MGKGDKERDIALSKVIIMTKAFVLCGGKGTRLRPYTYSIPKPMLPLGRKPILEFVIDNLKANGITDIYLTVGYLREQIKDYFGDGRRFGVRLHYSMESEQMNTAGSILPLRKEANETFVVVMGDHLSTINLRNMLAYHKKRGAIATIGLKRQGVPLEYGIAHVDERGFVKDFQEKPIVENLVNAAIYVFEPEIFKYISEKDDFAKNVFPKMLAKKEKIASYIFQEYWMDIGRTQDYEQMNKLISTTDLVLHHAKE